MSQITTLAFHDLALAQFPELREEFEDHRGLPHLQMRAFARLVQEAKGRADWETYAQAAALADALWRDADPALRNALNVSFLELIDFEDRTGPMRGRCSALACRVRGRRWRHTMRGCIPVRRVSHRRKPTSSVAPQQTSAVPNQSRGTIANDREPRWYASRAPPEIRPERRRWGSTEARSSSGTGGDCRPTRSASTLATHSTPCGCASMRAEIPHRAPSSFARMATSCRTRFRASHGPELAARVLGAELEVSTTVLMKGGRVGTAGLHGALAAGAPLVEIVVRFRENVGYRAATEAFNALGDDVDLHPGDWYNDPALRVGSATREALERLFGWRFVRVPLERYDDAAGTWGRFPDAFRWEELNVPERFPPSVADVVASIGCSQPGADDDGQWWE
jgi:hypothetical protein